MSDSFKPWAVGVVGNRKADAVIASFVGCRENWWGGEGLVDQGHTGGRECRRTLPGLATGKPQHSVRDSGYPGNLAHNKYRFQRWATTMLLNDGPRPWATTCLKAAIAPGEITQRALTPNIVRTQYHPYPLWTLGLRFRAKIRGSGLGKNSGTNHRNGERLAFRFGRQGLPPCGVWAVAIAADG